ncbi:hypothetical protein ACFPRL_28245 [Pseudoclavibacter helvolus]
MNHRAKTRRLGARPSSGLARPGVAPFGIRERSPLFAFGACCEREANSGSSMGLRPGVTPEASADSGHEPCAAWLSR